MASPFDEAVQLVLALLEEGGALAQHAADVVHLHGEHLIHVLLLDALLTDELHHPPALLQGLHLGQQGVLLHQHHHLGIRNHKHHHHDLNHPLRYERSTSAASVVNIKIYLDWVEVGAHDDLVQRSGQLGWQLGLLLQTLCLGVVVQPGSGEEVVDDGHTVMLAYRRRKTKMKKIIQRKQQDCTNESLTVTFKNQCLSTVIELPSNKKSPLFTFSIFKNELYNTQNIVYVMSQRSDEKSFKRKLDGTGRISS